MRNKRGITLVALVVTVLIMLVIAIISVRVLQNNNILLKSLEISEKSNEELEKLKVETAIQDATLADMDGLGEIKEKDLTQKLNDQFGKGNWEYVESEEDDDILFIVEIKATGRLYTIYNDETLLVSTDISIAAKTHHWQASTRIEPRCLSNGEQQYVCRDCGAIKVEILPKIGSHLFANVWEIVIPETCGTNGIEQRYCLRGCGETGWHETRIRLATGNHSYGEWNTGTATCTTAGIQTRICTVCGQAETRAQAALGHSWGDWVKTKEPTVNDDGSVKELGIETRTCGRCGATETRNIKLNTWVKTGTDTYKKGNVTLKIGDYVAYTYDNAGAYNLLAIYSGHSSDQSVPQKTGKKWIVYDISPKKNQVTLISTKDGGNTKIYFKGALGYNNGVYLLNDLCAKLYSNTSLSVTARSIRMEDITAKLTSSQINTIKTHSDGRYKHLDEEGYRTTNTYYPNLYAKEIGSGINTTTPRTNGIGPSDPYYTSPTTETSSNATTLAGKCTYWYIREAKGEIDSNIWNNLINAGGYDSVWIATRFSRVCTNPPVSTNTTEFGLGKTYNEGVNGSADSANYLFKSNGSNIGGSSNNFGYKPMVELGPTVEFTGAGNGTSGNPYVITRAPEGNQYIIVN